MSLSYSLAASFSLPFSLHCPTPHIPCNTSRAPTVHGHTKQPVCATRPIHSVPSEVYRSPRRTRRVGRRKSGTKGGDTIPLPDLAPPNLPVTPLPFILLYIFLIYKTSGEWRERRSARTSPTLLTAANTPLGSTPLPDLALTNLTTYLSLFVIIITARGPCVALSEQSI